MVEGLANMTDVRGLLIKLMEQYIGEWKYEMGSPTGYKCSWCGVVPRMRSALNDPEEHDETCPYRAALKWWIKEENQ